MKRLPWLLPVLFVAEVSMKVYAGVEEAVYGNLK
jgi:hypothetical protein